MTSSFSLKVVSRVSLACAFALAVFIVGSSLLGYSLFHFDMLRFDAWPVYEKFLDMPFWQSLWAAHTGHRLVFPNLLDRANMAWFGGNLTNLIIVSLALEALAGWLLVLTVAQKITDRWSYRLLFALVMSIMLWLGYKNALAWPFGLTYTMPVFGATAACYCLWISKITTAANGQWIWFAGAFAGALLATLSWGSGMVAWVVLFIMALALRLRLRYVLTILISGIVIIFLFFLHAPGDTGMGVHLPRTPHDIFTAVTVAVGILGDAPGNMLEPYAQKYSMAAIWLARATGLLSLALMGGFVVLWWRQREKRRYLIPLMGVALFVLGTALMVGLARYGAADSWYMWWGLSPRFANFSGLLWAALISGLFALAAERAQPTRHRFGASVAALVLLIALIPSQLYVFMLTGKQKRYAEESTLALVTNVHDDLRLWHSFWPPDKKLVLNVTGYLRRNNLTVFREPWTHWMGTRLSEKHGANDPIQLIPGGLSKAEKAKWGWKITGWTGASHRNHLIVAVDRRKRIRGIAKLTRQPKNADALQTQPASSWFDLLRGIDPRLPSILGWGRGWYGYVPRRYNPNYLHYYVVTKDKQVIGKLTPRQEPTQASSGSNKPH